MTKLFWSCLYSLSVYTCIYVDSDLTEVSVMVFQVSEIEDIRTLIAKLKDANTPRAIQAGPLMQFYLYSCSPCVSGITMATMY